MHIDNAISAPTGPDRIEQVQHGIDRTGTRPPAGGSEGPARRSLVTLGAAAALGVCGVGALAGCGSSSSGSSGATSSGASGTPAGSAGESSAGGNAAGGPLAKLADVPVGGSLAAKGADGKPIVIAQPRQGTVVAFSAICTHQGCKVTPGGAKLSCPCHGSMFDAFTGKNLSGPAPTPLPAVPVKISGTEVVSA